MGYITLNNKKYIDGGKIELITEERILVLLEPNTFRRSFIGYIEDNLAGEKYYSISSETFNYLDRINKIKYMPSFSANGLKNKLKRIAYKGTLFLCVSVAFFTTTDLVLKYTTPYNGQIMVDYAIAKLNNAVQVTTGLNATKYIVNNEISGEKSRLEEDIVSRIRERAKGTPYEQDYEDFVIPYVEAMIRTFPNKNMPHLESLTKLNIREYDVVEFKNMLNSSCPKSGYYDPISNTILIPNDEMANIMGKHSSKSSYEKKREITIHEINHANQGSTFSYILGYPFGGSLVEGTCQLMTFDVFNIEKDSSYSVSETAARILQEIVGPDVIAEYNFTLNTNLIIKGLANVYGNELDACKLISTLDNYCFNAEQRKDYSKNINYNKMMEDVTNQLIVYETAKMNNDIQNSVYNADSTGVDGFANELNYFNSLNWLLYAGLGDTISSDKNTSLKEKQDESKILCDSIDKFVETMKNRYQFKYGEEASAKMNAILEQLPMSFTRNYYSGNGEYVYYIANKTNSSSKETASDVDEGKTK